MRARWVRGVLVFAFLLGGFNGCGYTTKSLLRPDLKTICVENFANKIPVTNETSDARMYIGYRPRLEYDVTKAISDRYLFDGNLRIADRKTANLILKGELVDFRKEPLRYDANDNVEEYRVRLVTNLELTDAKTGTLMWKEKAFAGESTYRTGGSLATSEVNALNEAKSDLARRIVERTIEGW